MRPDDELWVTGTLGDSAAGLKALTAGLGGPDHRALIERHNRPTPRVIEARAAVATGAVRAMIDLSDGLAGDRASLGFMAETERQVESHLNDHLGRLPREDQRSRAILEQMRSDEVRHGASARAAGGIDLPAPVRGLMRLASRVIPTGRIPLII